MRNRRGTRERHEDRIPHGMRTAGSKPRHGQRIRGNGERRRHGKREEETRSIRLKEKRIAICCMRGGKQMETEKRHEEKGTGMMKSTPVKKDPGKEVEPKTKVRKETGDLTRTVKEGSGKERQRKQQMKRNTATKMSGKEKTKKKITGRQAEIMKDRGKKQGTA